EELLSSLFTSKVGRHNKQSAPYWRVSLANLCRMVSGLSAAEQGGEGEHSLTHTHTHTHTKVMTCTHPLKIYYRCILRNQKSNPKNIWADESNDSPLKRKSPYILKRQAGHSTKSRRPYILKRSAVY
uniref:Neurotensin/neuromedin N n=1 Tax=Salarias fasciatus TaxID=181472 RepID=A0A672JG59_SALFA